MKLLEISIDLIDFPSFDVRYFRDPAFLRLLCSDIAREGMLVKPILRSKSNGRFEVIDGINRLSCAKRLGWKSVSCDVVESRDDAESIILGLKINMRRRSHDVVGICESFKRLRELGMKQVEIAKRFGFTKGHVSKLLALTKLSPEDKLRLSKNQLSIPQAYSIVKKRRDPELMEHLKIQYACELCHGKVSFGSIELLQICSECKRKLTELLAKEQLKRKHDKAQTELPT